MLFLAIVTAPETRVVISHLLLMTNDKSGAVLMTVVQYHQLSANKYRQNRSSRFENYPEQTDWQTF